ncbi:MAG: hypothetical protein IPL07_05450 [Acidimicrobiaceae bacterium]|nr:hypothetical protein [Acidimicrobiaceae bacterium]
MNSVLGPERPPPVANAPQHRPGSTIQAARSVGPAHVRIKFPAFLAPHHPLGESPTLQFQRDLDLAAHLDRLGYDEFLARRAPQHRVGDDRQP